MNRSLILLSLLSLLITVAHSDCYKNWSRCTPQTKSWTGILWKSCPDYCRKCQGYSSGGCKKVHNKACSGGYQCRCSGGRVSKSGNWADIATCKLGL